MEWDRRPVVSHVLAHLAATRAIRKTHKILDIGCGQGVDLLALAAWGFKDLEGFDYNEAEILTAQAEERKLVQEEVLKKRGIKWRKGS